MFVCPTPLLVKTGKPYLAETYGVYKLKSVDVTYKLVSKSKVIDVHGVIKPYYRLISENRRRKIE